MPRVEFENEKQRQDFLDWKKEKLADSDNLFLGRHGIQWRNEKGSYESGSYYVYIIDGEMVGYFFPTLDIGSGRPSIIVSEKLENNLREAGVIFDQTPVSEDAVVDNESSARQEGYPISPGILK